MRLKMGDYANAIVQVKKEDQQKVAKILVLNNIIPSTDTGVDLGNDKVEFDLSSFSYAGEISNYDFLLDEKIPCSIHYGSGSTYGSGNIIGRFKDGEYSVQHFEDGEYQMLHIDQVITMVEAMSTPEQLLAELRTIKQDQESSYDFT